MRSIRFGVMGDPVFHIAIYALWPRSSRPGTWYDYPDEGYKNWSLE